VTNKGYSLSVNPWKKSLDRLGKVKLLYYFMPVSAVGIIETLPRRTVVLPPTVLTMLRSRFESTNPEPDALVFPAPKGGYLNDNRFRGKIWKPVLESCGVEYRYPYNLRHSGVSHAAAGASLAELSEQTGHSKKVLLSTYLHSVDRKCVFVEF
jgi:integrase